MGTLTSYTTYKKKDLTAYDTGNWDQSKILLLHDYWGLTESFKVLADRFSHQGFRVFAPDYMSGQMPTSLKDAQECAWKLDLTDISEVLIPEALSKHGPSHVIGLGLGASMALLAQQHDRRIQSVTTSYGYPPLNQLKKVNVPIILTRTLKYKLENPVEMQKIIEMAPKATSFEVDADVEYQLENRPNFDFSKMRQFVETVSALLKKL